MKASQARLQDNILDTVNKMYTDRSISVDMFRNFAVDLIESARAPNHGMINELKNTTYRSKDPILFKLYNFQSKGVGYGVI